MECHALKQLAKPNLILKLRDKMTKINFFGDLQKMKIKFGNSKTSKFSYMKQWFKKFYNLLLQRSGAPNSAKFSVNFLKMSTF